MQQTTCKGNRRVIGLDLFRISLALLIFLFHSHIHSLRCDYGLLNGFVDIGAIAMTGFFLLSGYALNLVYGKKDMTDRKEMKRFYLKRLVSILPLYYAWAIVNVVYNIVANGKVAALQELILFPVEALGIQSVYSSLFEFSHNDGSWFISCILICYFIYPLLHQQTCRLSDKARVWLIIIAAATLLWAPIVQHYFKLQSIYSNPFFRLLEFTIGMLVSQINNKEQTGSKIMKLLRSKAMCAATAVCLVVGVSVAYYIGIPYDYMLYNWIVLPCYMSLLISLGYIKFESLKDSRAVSYLSSLAFSIFLSQLIFVWDEVGNVLAYIGCDANIAKITLSAIACFIIANIFHYGVEKPATRFLKSRLHL